jgi:NADH dehydrogenase (ubiquinone) Fe-S protein 6
MIPLRSLRRAPTHLWSAATHRAYSTTLKEAPVSVPKMNDAAAATTAAATATTASTDARDAALTETADAAADMRAMQAPNWRGTWTRSQQVREKAMAGPRFEQMVMEDQVRP